MDCSLDVGEPWPRSGLLLRVRVRGRPTALGDGLGRVGRLVAGLARRRGDAPREGGGPAARRAGPAPRPGDPARVGPHRSAGGVLSPFAARPLRPSAGGTAAPLPRAGGGPVPPGATGATRLGAAGAAWEPAGPVGHGGRAAPAPGQRLTGWAATARHAAVAGCREMWPVLLGLGGLLLVLCAMLVGHAVVSGTGGAPLVVAAVYAAAAAVSLGGALVGWRCGGRAPRGGAPPPPGAAARPGALWGAAWDAEAAASENVMGPGRVACADAAEEAVVARYGPPDPAPLLAEVRRALAGAAGGAAPWAAAAQRTLDAPAQDLDHGPALAATPRDAALLAALWAGAATLPEAAAGGGAAPAALLRHGLTRALADCIGADGHRVCGVGIRQRLLAAGRGHLPEIGPELPPVGLLLAELGASFAAACGGAPPSPSRLQRFYVEARLVGELAYVAAPAERAAFAAHLAAYLAHDYGWCPPARGGA